MADQRFIDALDESKEVDLTVTGRSSGRQSTRPVWFVREGQEIDLVPIYGTDSGWFKNVSATTGVRLAVGDSEVAGDAVTVTDAGRVAAIVDAFRAKYGADTFERLYPNPNAAVVVPLD
jgi:hypothetical protein